MRLSNELSSNLKTCLSEEKQALRFELFDWLKSKDLTIKEATDLLTLTRDEIFEARKLYVESLRLSDTIV